MKNLNPGRILLMAVLAATIFSCQPDEEPPIQNLSMPARNFASDVPLSWFTLYQDIDRYSPGYRPPAAARMLAYTGLAGYEAAVPGMPDYNSFSGYFPGLVLPKIEEGLRYHWPTAVNAAYHTMFVNFYPHIQESDKTKIEDLNRFYENRYIARLDYDVFYRSREFGKAVAEVVFAWSAIDEAGHEAFLNPHPTDYIPPAGQGLWVPSGPDYTPALFPYWAQVRTFAIKSQDMVGNPPLPFSEEPASALYLQAKEVEEVTNKAKSGEDDEAMWIAEFWSDDIFQQTFQPAARQIAIGNQLIQLEQPSLEVAVEMYAKMGMSLCDAGVAIWKVKYDYNIERPVTYIRRLIDPSWTSALNNTVTGVQGVSPPFPAYPSGHSGFGAAGAAVLKDIFGNNYQFTDNCHRGRTEFRGEPRTFSNFDQMAEENAYSRIPLGVHFRMDCVEGLRLGYLAGDRVMALPWKK
jgi:hypothetical protein